MMNPMQVLEIVLTFIGGIAASTGFWAFITKRNEKNTARDRLLMGIAFDRIMYLGDKYCQRGWITQAEYESLCEYLFIPYKEMGGNGSAKRIMAEVDKLPIYKDARHKEEHETDVAK